jgi:CheY-like chemotaxis protein
MKLLSDKSKLELIPTTLQLPKLEGIEILKTINQLERKASAKINKS